MRPTFASTAVAAAMAVCAAAPAAGEQVVAVAEGHTDALQLTHSAFDLPSGVPDAVVHVPAGFRADTPYGVVLFLHGWNGCARVLVEEGATGCRPGETDQEGWGLGHAHDAAGTNTVLVVPQLAFRARDGSAGRLAHAGYARTLLDEALAASLHEAGRPPPPSRVVLVAHSAGYEAALAVLRRGRLVPPTSDVVLMDALYAGGRMFAQWLLDDGGRRLVSIYTARSGRPAHESARLAQWMRRRHPEVRRVRLRSGWTADDASAGRLVIAASQAAHREVPARHLAQTLRALALPLRPR